MLKILSIRWKLTILSAVLLSLCCLGLTFILNVKAFQLADKLDSSVVSTPAMDVIPTPKDESTTYAFTSYIATDAMMSAKKWFSIQSMLYMFIIIMSGSAFTYYFTGKALSPLKTLNKQVKNVNIYNLTEILTVPLAKDEIAELTESFNLMTNKLNDAFMSQKRFSASIAHELRTPLAVLQTKVDVFKKKNSHTNHEYKELLAILEKQIIRLRGLVGNILNMMSVDKEKEQSVISLKDLFEDIVSDLFILAEEKNISLQVSCDNSKIQGNAELLYRAFYNLVENGIKYNKNNGYVKIKVSRKEKKIIVSVTDNGIGIPDEMKKHIFEPFYRVDKSRSREVGGAGLGLSIVDSIIKKHGGQIYVFDGEDSGTSFEVIF